MATYHNIEFRLDGNGRLVPADSLPKPKEKVIVAPVQFSPVVLDPVVSESVEVEERSPTALEEKEIEPEQKDLQQMNVFVMTSDKYTKTLRGFAHLFKKYWHPWQNVIVCGYTAPDFDLPSNFTFYSIGNMEDYPVDKWSDSLIHVLEHFPHDKVLCLMLEDYWITDYVQQREVEMLYNYMMQFDYVLKMDLFTDRRYAGGAEEYPPCGHIPLVKSDYKSAYHMSLMCGLWNRKRLLEVLIPNESPWDIELVGTPRLARKGDDVLVLGTKSWTEEDGLCPVRHTLAHRSGNPEEYMLDEVKPKDLKVLQEIGFV